MANHEENDWEWQGKKFKAEPGQFVTSLESIAKTAGKGITIDHVRTAIERFRKLDFLTNKSTKTGRLITIVNWESYQDTEKKSQSKNQRTPKQLPTNNNEINIYNNVPFEEIKNKFNEICSELPQVKSISSKRRIKIATRWKEQPDINYWIEIFKKVQASDFLNGKSGNKWKCSFDWIFDNDTNYIKILEGNYSNKAGDEKDEYRLPG